MKPCLAALLFLFASSPLAAQSSVTAVRGLAFGIVIRGVPSTVAPSDPIKSGRFYIRHILNRQVRVAFTLPTQLPRVGGGGNLPIRLQHHLGDCAGYGWLERPRGLQPEHGNHLYADDERGLQHQPGWPSGPGGWSGDWQLPGHDRPHLHLHVTIRRCLVGLVLLLGVAEVPPPRASSSLRTPSLSMPGPQRIGDPVQPGYRAR